MAASIRANCRKVICIGRNYADHITELNSAKPKQPFFFLKPSSSILGPNEGPVLQPAGVDVHFEVELGLVIGKTVRDLDPSDTKGALDAIDSYILAIDLTARNVQNEAKKKGLPWSIAKGFDTFLPISNPIPKDTIRDPHNLGLKLSVDGSVKQNDNTNLMLFQIPRQLADISSTMTLEKGDVVLTGTPKGVGSVKPGQIMRAVLELEGKELPEATIEVGMEEKGGRYVFRET